MQKIESDLQVWERHKASTKENEARLAEQLAELTLRQQRELQALLNRSTSMPNRLPAFYCEERFKEFPPDFEWPNRQQSIADARIK